MGPSELGVLPSKLSIAIREAYAQAHRRVFWPSQFVKAGIASEDRVLASLEELVNRGELVLVGELRCPDGHALRKVTATSLPMKLAPETVECMVCAPDHQGPPHLRVWFEVTPDFEAIIKPPPEAEKKQVG